MLNLTRQFIVLAVAFVAAVPALAQLPVDDQRVRLLETEIQRLQREVDAQARRIDSLEQAARIVSSGPSVAGGPRAQDSSPAWLVTANWDRVKTGMKTPDVIAILGRPTSTRHDADGKLRMLFYAMELGQDEILSGTIRMDDSGVTEINRPIAK